MTKKENDKKDNDKKDSDKNIMTIKDDDKKDNDKKCNHRPSVQSQVGESPSRSWRQVSSSSCS